MFTIAAVVLIAFTILYVFFAWSILYHLRQYTLPGHATPKIFITLFTFLTVLFWLFAVYFLFQMP